MRPLLQPYKAQTSFLQSSRALHCQQQQLLAPHQLLQASASRPLLHQQQLAQQQSVLSHRLQRPLLWLVMHPQPSQ